MGARESRLVPRCCRCTALVAIAICCSSPCSSPARKGYSKRPGSVHDYLIFSVFTAATPKSHWYPFMSFKYPLLRQSIPRIQVGQSQWGTFPTDPLLSSLQPPNQTIFGIPLSIQRSRWVLSSRTPIAPAYTMQQQHLPKPCVLLWV